MEEDDIKIPVMKDEKDKFSNSLKILEESNPVSSDIGVMNELKEIKLMEKITNIVNELYEKVIDEEDDELSFRDKLSFIGTLIKLRGSLSQDIGFLADKIEGMSENKIMLLLSFLEQHELKRGFKKSKLDMRRIFKG